MAESCQLKLCSASTSSGRNGGAYEIKFLLPDAIADKVHEQVRTQLPADPHAEPVRGDGYRVSTLYFDTPGLDTYRRVGSHGRRKFRLRRYGSDSKLFLERKSKLRGLVKKRRTMVSDSEIVMLHNPEPDPTWAGFWYQRRLTIRRLDPVCNVTYERSARVGMTTEGPIRFTVDRQVRCRPAVGLSVPVIADGSPLLTGMSIVEMKFCVAMPALFKALIYEFALTPSHVSKFRLSIEACGLAPKVDESMTEQDNAGSPPHEQVESCSIQTTRNAINA